MVNKYTRLPTGDDPLYDSMSRRRVLVHFLRQTIPYVALVCIVLYIASSFLVKNEYTVYSVEEPDVTSLRSNWSIVVKNGVWDEEKRENNKEEQLGATNEKCVLPKLDVNSPEIAPFYIPVPPINCSGKYEENWAYASMGTIKLKEKYSSAKCVGRPLENKLGKKTKVGFPFTVPTDGYQLECKMGEKQWSNIFLTIAKTDKNVIEEQRKKVEKKAERPISVYLLGIDSISQVNMRRMMPLTMEYLEKKMGSIVFNGYSTLGDGTVSAFSAILAGTTKDDLPTIGFNRQADVSKMALNDFKTNGYMTMYAEDCYDMGIFYTNHGGFHTAPSHHFPRPFFKQQEKMNEKLWYWYRLYCNGDVEMYKEYFKYLGEFFHTYNTTGLPLMAITQYATMSHEDFNQLDEVDITLRDHVRGLHESGFFENTIVFAMSDHGQRFRGLRETQQGQFEERLPFFSVYVPEKLRNTAKFKPVMENLQWNKDVLTTHYDLHKTLKQIANSDFSDLDKSYKESEVPKGASLFRKIPKSRNCAQAGLNTHYCPCTVWENLDLKEPIVDIIVDEVVRVFTSQTERNRNICAPLRVKSVKSAKRLRPRQDILNAEGDKIKGSSKTRLAYEVKYQLNFITFPGNANFEVTVSHNEKKNILTVDLATVSHISKYGDRPHCIWNINRKMAFYCVCYDKITEEEKLGLPPKP